MGNYSENEDGADARFPVSSFLLNVPPLAHTLYNSHYNMIIITYVSMIPRIVRNTWLTRRAESIMRVIWHRWIRDSRLLTLISDEYFSRAGHEYHRREQSMSASNSILKWKMRGY